MEAGRIDQPGFYFARRVGSEVRRRIIFRSRLAPDEAFLASTTTFA
jgi:hypothetical protein